MEKMIGYCGIICSNCPVMLATQKDDDVERRRVADVFTKQYGNEFKPEDINCDGCISDSKRIFPHCHVCGIRKCGIDKKVKNCAYCSEYLCQKVSEVFASYRKAKETLDEVRRARGSI